MALKFNPFTGTFDLTGLSGYLEVATYANLPSPIGISGAKYLVLASTGTWILGTKKDAGLYYSNGTTWSLMPNVQDYFLASDFAIKNSNGYNLKFDITALTGDRTITLSDTDISNIVTGTGASVVAQIPVFSTTGNKVAGSVNLVQTATSGILNVRGTNPGINIDGSGTNASPAIGLRETGTTNLFYIQCYGTTYATSALRGAVDFRNYRNSYINFATNNSDKLRLQADGSLDLLGTNLFRLGGTGTGSDYTHAVTGGTVSLISKPRVDDATAFKWQNAAGSADVITLNTTTPRIGVNTGTPEVIVDAANKIGFVYDATTGEQCLCIKVVANETIVKGNVCSYLQGGTANRLVKTPTTGNENDMVVGVAYTAAANAGDSFWMAITGIVQVLPQTGVTPTLGYVIYTSATVAGTVDQAAAVPAAATHFKEVGHFTESAAQNALCKAIIHFN